MDVTVDDLEFMDDAIHRYGLLPRDALHLSAMQRCNFNLFSTDPDFDRVPFVQRYTLTS
jgi:predicted nucleic acid-binding protein